MLGSLLKGAFLTGIGRFLTESWSNDVAFRFLSLDSVFLIGVYAENIDEADRVLRLCVESINARIIPVAREGELPNTLEDSDDRPIKIDYEDLLIIKELEVESMPI